MQPRPTAPSASGYRYEWLLFADWCAAADLAPLPASPVTLAEFLGDNPASDSVQIRRVSAINRGHLDADHPPPGRATSLRLALDSARAGRTRRRARQYMALAAALPTEGSAAALFGRRDAVLLMLSGAGLSHQAIAALDRKDISADGDSVWIGGAHRIRINADEASGSSPVEMWERWRIVVQFSDRYPSTALLVTHLQANTFPDMTGFPDWPGPVALPIDRWGHLPFPATAMTAAAIGAVLDAHRTGIPPQHVPPRRHSPRSRECEDMNPSATAPEQISAPLSAEYYSVGVDARRRAHTALADVPDLVDDVEDRIEVLLQRTLDLLGDDTEL
ncbi:hypothetical protein DK926_19635 [Rhodococcus sp. Eu-32]|uniref:hypothetical protein n=1 Tax=Rhodococcus sp. Eu-32 TaxID=1017319 RepID=UPI000DF42FF9|nr:hypothetical protein [Rhodococcus sp. Eu-32]RRQ26208.1 hypothetical protein DK926_19635 [Rhodococcus sp. Eu-32]